MISYTIGKKNNGLGTTYLMTIMYHNICDNNETFFVVAIVISYFAG